MNGLIQSQKAFKDMNGAELRDALEALFRELRYQLSTLSPENFTEEGLEELAERVAEIIAARG